MCSPEAGRLLADFAALFGFPSLSVRCSWDRGSEGNDRLKMRDGRDLPAFTNPIAFTVIHRVLASRRSTRSMRLRHSNILATLVCGLLQLGATTGFTHGLVLCVADDGHVAVESSDVAGRCADYRRYHPEPLSELGSDGDPHACTDTVLGPMPAWRGTDLASSMPSRPIAVTAILGSSQTDHATLVVRVRASADGNGPFDCRIGSLRSVVLVA